MAEASIFDRRLNRRGIRDGARGNLLEAVVDFGVVGEGFGDAAGVEEDDGAGGGEFSFADEVDEAGEAFGGVGGADDEALGAAEEEEGVEAFGVEAP